MGLSMTKKIYKLLLILGIIFSANSASLAASLDISGNYVYKGSSEKLVLSFPSKGVVLFRRYEGRWGSSGLKFSKTPIENIYAPYIVKSKNSAKALICQHGNPKGSCWAKEFSLSGDNVKWGRSTYVKSSDSFAKSKYDKGPYTFNKLKNMYSLKMKLIK